MYVIFDTNVYRDLTHGLGEGECRKRFHIIKEAEVHHGIIPVLSTVTAMELLAHLADQKDPAFDICKMAAVAAGFHVLRPNNQVSIYPHPQLHLQQLIFENYDESAMSKFEIIAEIVNFLNKGPADLYIEKFNEQITEIRRMVVQHETDFKATMLRVIKGIDPETTTWTALANDKEKRKRTLKYLEEKEEQVLDTLALGYVHKAMNARNQPLSPTEQAVAAIDVTTYFHTALRLHLAIMKKMLIGGFDMDNKKRNRENTIWDIYQLFCVSDATMNDLSATFVTADTWLHEICQDSGLQSKIIRKGDYMRMLKLDVV